MKEYNENVVVELEEVTFIQKHAKKILLIGGLTVGAGAYYIIKKHGVEIDKLKISNDLKDKAIEKHRDEIKTLHSAASEGLYDEAIATVTRKINTVIDRIQVCEERLLINTMDMQTKKALDDYNLKLEILTSRLDKFNEAQKIFNVNVE